MMEDGTRARHAAHEMARFLELHVEMKNPSCEYLPIIWHSMRTTYATHVRNLLEFFHERSPHGGGGKAAKDIKYGELVDPNPYRGNWTEEEEDWWNQATQLASHLGGERSDHGELDEWEDRGCEKALVPMIKDAVARVPDQLRLEGADVPRALARFLAATAAL